MAIIVRRELERLAFVPAAYCDLRANLSAVEDNAPRTFTATVVEVDGRGKVATGRDFDSKGQLQQGQGKAQVIHLVKESAAQLMEGLKQKGTSWKVKKVEKRAQRRKPPPPFITSTLQQEANRKLSLSSKECMLTAQKLYESGLITYMRTDNPILSESALAIASKRAAEIFGPEAVPPADAAHRNIKKPKGSQEAHEPIRPAVSDATGTFLLPKETGLHGKEAQLYELIFQRTLASVMCDAELDLTSVDILGEPADRSRDSATFRATGRVIRKHGWMLAYLDSSDEQQGDTQRLPFLQSDQELLCSELRLDEHSTKPPARYTEATLVKELEELGVGRPSTYTQIIETLKGREYVSMEGKALSPTLIAFVVTRLLETYFRDFIDTSFTARMEEELDRIARGEIKKEDYLSRYYLGDGGLRNQVEISESKILAEDARQVKLPSLEPYAEEFQVLVGSYGAYVQAKKKGGEGKRGDEGAGGGAGDMPTVVKANIPQMFCKDVNQLTPDRIRKCLESRQGPHNGILLGQDDDEQPILLRVGPYGLYLQKGDDDTEGKAAKRVPLPEGMDPDGVSLETAKAYLQLPRVICNHPETGAAIQVGVGRYGQFLLYQGTYRSLPASDDIFAIDCSRAVEIINAAAASPRSTRVLAELGEHEKQRVAVVKGRFGPYIKCGSVNAPLPEHLRDSPEDCTLEEAIEAIKLKSPQKGKASPKKKSSPTAQAKDDKSASPSKRSRSSYVIFCAEKRPQLKEKGLEFGEISKELSSMWNELSEEDKTPYVEMARLEKLKYQEASEEDSKSSTMKKAGKASKTASSPRKGSSATKKAAEKSSKKSSKKAAISRLKSINTTTKRPLSAYLHFCREKRPLLAQEGLSFGEISKRLAEKWKVVDKETKSKYEDMVRAERLSLGHEKEAT